MVIASSISGLPIYAPSAAFAPTNSGDVSAIASSYQVVSSTATQLYAGTAYVTSINDAPVSAARAGNAANASLSNSAWYDGTGRLISALPDSAAVSAIASSYVESGVSSKQDTLSFAYNTADQISSINGSALGGMDEAAVSGIASAYAESAASSKADSSALSSYVPYSSLEYNTASAISGINGSALAAGSTYSAGEGIDITDDVISVEAPVDIVAGPGIVIDNPDGNTLRVSMAQNYETVLWANTGTSAVTSMSLSEDVRNFDRFRVYWLWNNGTDFVSRADEFSNFYTGTTHRVFGLDGIYRYGGTTFTMYSRFVLDTSYSSITYEYSNQNNDTAKYIVVNKIVGINRTASAQ